MNLKPTSMFNIKTKVCQFRRTNERKFLSIMIGMFMMVLNVTSLVHGQINYSQTFTGCTSSPCGGWDWSIAGSMTATVSMGYSPCAVADPAARANLSASIPTGNLSATASLGTSTGEIATFSFIYKCMDFNTGSATAANSCTFNVEYATSAMGPWTSIQTFQNVSSVACTPFVSNYFFPTIGQPIFMRVRAVRNSGDFWVVIDNIALSQPTPALIESTSCTCNNDQTVNLQNGTYTTALKIRYTDNAPMPAGLTYTITTSTGLTNISGGTLGTPTFQYCNGTGCPAGIAAGQYYLSVRVQNSGAYTAAVDGPDLNSTADINLNTNCATLYPALPVIPFSDRNCLELGLNTFMSDNSVFNINNSLSNITLPTGFSQTGTGNLTINNNTFNENDNNPTFELFQIKEVAGCRVLAYKEFKVFKAKVASMDNTLLACRDTISRDTLYLTRMLSNMNNGVGKFFINGTEVPGGKIAVTGPICVDVTYSITDSCGAVKSDTKTLQITIKPKAAFNFATGGTNPISPVCTNAPVTVNVIRTSQGPNPTYTVTANKTGFTPTVTPTMTGATLTLPDPPIGTDVQYTVCLVESNALPTPTCGTITPVSEVCSDTICKKFVLYRDRSDCGANALFTGNCEVYEPAYCQTYTVPGLRLHCDFFDFQTPNILTADVNLDQGVLNCDSEFLTGSYNVSFFGINFGPTAGCTKVEDLPFINIVCSVIGFEIFGWKPLGALYDALRCDKCLIEFISAVLGKLAGGDGGGVIVMADTDGDGGFDYLIENRFGFPVNGTFSIPNRVKGGGTMAVRAVGAWVNSPADVCGNFDISSVNILDKIPIGSIPVVGAIIEDILQVAGCQIDVALGVVTDATAKVLNNATPVFASCNPSGYVYAQTLECTIPVDWANPSANDGCSGAPLVYRGITSGADVSGYAGNNLPVPVTITQPGIYQTAGPVPGSILPPNIYPVTYTAVSCNGLPETCTFNIVVTSGNPILECPRNITVSTDVDACAARVNGLAPYQGLGCASIINYRYTTPVTNTVVQTTSTVKGTHNIPDGHSFELGVTTVTYIMEVDINGDGDYSDTNETQTCNFTITVLDGQNPRAVCLDVELQLNNLGQGTVFAEEVNNRIYVDGGSTDNCAGNLIIQLSKDRINYQDSLNFDCAEIGQNVVTLRVTDAAGNVNICKAVIKVIDFFEGFKLDLDVPEVCFEPFQNTYDFSKYIAIARPNGANVSHANVSTLGPRIFGAFGISAFLPDPGSTNDPGTMTTDGIYTLGTGTGWITISYILSIEQQVNQIDDVSPLTGCFRMVHDVFRVEKLDPVWKGGFMCCDQLPVWLGGANWNGTGAPPIPAGMLSLTDIRGAYPGDAYGEWAGQGVSFMDPDGIKFSGDEFYQFNPSGLDGTYTITYSVGDEPCIFNYAQDIRVTCQDLQIGLTDITVCPANWVPERVVIVNLDDRDLVVSTTGFAALAADGAHYGGGPVADPVRDLVNVVAIKGRVVIPGFYAPAVRDKNYQICVTTYQTTPFGCTDVFCTNIRVQDLLAPDFQNCPKEAIVVDAPQGWCSSFVNFEYPWAEDNCMGLYSNIKQVDLTGLKSGDLFPVGLTILAYTATDTVGNQSYCELKIVVNDYHTPPSITCPANKEQVNDLDKCGAKVNNIAPVKVDDNCKDNLAIIYEVTDATGKTIGCGLEDASGDFFPVGTSTVKYRVEDQPLILITEVLQNGVMTGVEITNFGPAAVDVTCGKFLMKNSAGIVVDSFVIPTRNNKSTYGTSPIYPPDPVMWVLPNPNIVPVGGTFTHLFRINPVAGANMKYCFNFLERVIDEAIINGDVKGETILRKDVCDHNRQDDFIPATPCDPGSFNMLNPGLPTMTPNGTTTSLQNYPPSMAMCSFNVKVTDVEAPTCIKHDTITIANTMVPMNISANTCLVSTINMPAGIVNDVNIRNLRATISNAGAVTAFLSSPSGTRIKLFSNVCPNQPNINVNLDETIVWVPAPSIVNALCNPLGQGLTYRPEESFKAFYGEPSGGLWTLEIFTAGNVTGVLTSWNLQVLNQRPYDQPSVVLENALLLCTREFSWIHPILEDNCCKGKVDVTYTFVNNVTGESSVETGVIANSNGTINVQGLRITKTFKVGKTTVEYTLEDQYGNLNTCGFMVTVLDTEKPRFVAPGCNDRVISLGPGACTGQLVDPPKADDNCAVKKVTFCYANGDAADITQLPIGVYDLVAKAEDIYGNLATCTFKVSVIEFIPNNATLACNDHLNISLDNKCEAVLNADMILEGGPYRCYDNYCIEVRDASGNLHPNIFTLADEGKTFTVSIIDCNGPKPYNSCWGTITIEEKLIPVFKCPADLTLACNIDIEARHPVTKKLLTGEAVLESCEVGATIFYQDEWINFGQCNNPRALVKRVWSIIDNEGNRVDCTQNLTIRPLDLNDVVFPADLDFDKAISCEAADKDPLATSPVKTGYPMLNGLQVNYSGSLCMVSLNYTDEIYDICDGSYEILRYWKVRNMCLPVSGTNPRTHVQVIKVLDTKGPKIVDCPADITVSVSPWHCLADLELPTPSYIEDLCSQDFEFRYLIIGGGRITGRKDSLNRIHVSAYGMQKGQYTIKYLFKDHCGNKSECSFKVTVIDASPPVAVAKQNIVLSLTGSGSSADGAAKIYGWQIDNGSYDHCTDVRFEVRRPTGSSCGNDGVNGHNNNSTYNGNNFASEIPGQTWFHPNDSRFAAPDGNLDTDSGEFVKFCCADIPPGAEFGLHDVEMRVWDDGNMNGIYGDNLIINGLKDNYNTTWVTIRVENKLPPTLICPPNVTVTCDMDINLSLDAETNVKDVNLTMTGYPSAFDLCSALEVTYRDAWIGQSNPVCKTGTIRRTFTVRKGSIVVTCPQIITISGITAPFTVNFPQNNQTTVWNDCEFTLDDARDASNPTIKKPIVNYGQCDIVGENIKIDTFLFEDGACKKWKVEYTYFNWCTNTTLGGYVHYYTYKDNVAPVLTCRNQMFAANPNPLNLSGGCEASVVLDASASDLLVCADESWVKWQSFIDLWNNGTVDRIASSFVNKAWEGIWIAVPKFIGTVQNPQWTSLQNQHPNFPLADPVYVTYIRPTKASGGTATLPAFLLDAENISHKVLWKITDGCGNVDQCESTLMVVDKKAPTPYCVSLSTALMQTNPKMVELWARDFDKGSFDNCTPQSKLYYTFEGISPILSRVNEEHFFKAGTTESINATAAEYNAGNAYKWLPSSRSAGKVWVACGDYTVNVSVWDEAWNTDFCSTSLKVIGCEGGSIISGNVSTAQNQSVKNVTVTLHANLPEYPKTVTTRDDGIYGFNAVYGSEYEMMATKDGDYSNGVTTLDLVLMQRHILGIEPFDSPYKVIASDANNDGKLTASDLTELRKLILGISNKFKNASWRFPVANKVPDMLHPFPYEEVIAIPSLTGDMNNQNFTAVKIGDVNGSSTTDIRRASVEPRNQKMLEFIVPEQEFRAGEMIALPVTSDNFDQIFGYQLTWESSKASFIGVQAGVLEIDETQCGIIKGEVMTMSFAGLTSMKADPSEILFTVLLKAHADGKVSESLKVSSAVTKMESYTSDFTVGKVSLEVRTAPLAGIELFQNEPNPFRGQTAVSFYMPATASASISVYDVTGRLVAVRKVDAVKGLNSEIFTREQLGASGVLYYTLESGDFTATKKMIIVE